MQKTLEGINRADEGEVSGICKRELKAYVKDLGRTQRLLMGADDIGSEKYGFTKMDKHLHEVVLPYCGDIIERWNQRANSKG